MDLQTKIQSQTSAGDLGSVVGVGGFRVGKLGKFAHSCNKGKLSEDHVNDNDVHSSDKVCSSAHNYCGCLVDGSVTRTAY